MAHHTLVSFLLVVAASFLGAFFDVRTRRIPNALVIALFAAGLAVNAISGIQFLAVDAIVTIAALLLGTLAFSFRLIGGGDIKLCAAAAGTLGFPYAVPFILFTFLSGGVIALIFAAAGGRLRATFANVRGLTLPLLAGVAPQRLTSGMPMPYALAICAGATASLATSGILPHLRF